MKNILLVFLVIVSVANAMPDALGQSKVVIKVNVSPQANNNSPVALDLVLIKNKKLLKELMKISATEWFEKRNQYRLDYPKETGLSAGSWEWVPGQVVKIDPIPIKSKLTGGIIFAHYFTLGAHRALLDLRKTIVVNLGADDFTVETQK